MPSLLLTAAVGSPVLGPQIWLELHCSLPACHAMALCMSHCVVIRLSYCYCICYFLCVVCLSAMVNPYDLALFTWPHAMALCMPH